MDIVTLGAALNGSAEYVNSHFKGGSNIQIVDNPDGTQTINASGEVSAEDTVARADIAAIKDGETLDSFGDVETALGSKQDTISDLSTIRSGAALGATAVQPETGKGLSTNDYTTTEKTKLAGIAEGAEVNVQANWTQTTSTADDYIKNKPTLGTAAALDVAASGNASTSQVVKGNDTRLTDARNAADVSSWAKAANKPSYNGSEIALTGYTEAQSKSSVAATDTANAAIGKLEYRVETNENNILYIEKANGKKNLIPYFDTIVNGGCTYKYSAGGVVTVTGNKSGALSIATLIDNASLSEYGLSAGDQIVLVSNNTNIGTVVIFEDSQGTQDAAISAYNEVKTVTIPSGRTKWYVRLQVKPATTGTINETAKPMICDKKLYDIDPTVTPYAMSNVELTEAEQQNKNNILLNEQMNGKKNYCKTNTVTFTGYNQVIYTDAISGDAVLYIGDITSTDTDSSENLVIFYNTNNQQVGQRLCRRGQPVVYDNIQLGANVLDHLVLYSSDNYAHSSGDTVTYTDIMICSKAAYTAFPAYQPYAMSNAELTAAIQALQAQLANE